MTKKKISTDDMGDLAITGAAATAAFLAANGLDRFLATYDPAGSTRPTDTMRF